MRSRKVRKHLGVGPQLAREFKDMQDERRKELEAHIRALCEEAKINPAKVECIEYAKITQILTVYTAAASLEVGFSPSFGPPRHRSREFFTRGPDPITNPTVVPQEASPEDETVEMLLNERLALILGILQEGSPDQVKPR